MVGGGVADASGPAAGVVVFGVPRGEVGERVFEAGFENDEAQNVVVEGGSAPLVTETARKKRRSETRASCNNISSGPIKVLFSFFFKIIRKQ